MLALFLGSATVMFFLFRDSLSLATLATQESEWRDYYQVHPALVLLLAFLIYVVVTGMSLPGAAVLSLVYAWYLGFWPALMLISFASTLGASLAFLLSRYLFRDLFQSRFAQHLVSFNSNLEKEGAFYLFTLRLIPAVPFFVINLVMGLTPMKVRTFWWVSQVGMLPGTVVFCWAGSSVPSLDQLVEQGVSGIITPQLFIGFVLLGAFPLMVRKLLGHFRGHSG
ncbi:MAG: VTT domain-containing protein [Mariniblastus sp.]|nr:VTT domain-containing protein [Mariniblastus sp.]